MRSRRTARVLALMVIVTGVIAGPAPLVGGAGTSQWPTANGNARRTGFNSNETAISVANAATLTRKWRMTIGAALDFTSPVVAGGVVYAQGGAGRLWAIDAQTGQVRWKKATGGAPTQSSPAVANGVVYLGGSDGKLYAFNARNGALRWTGQTGGPIDAPPVVADRRVFVTGGDLKAYAFDAATGRTLWSAPTGTSPSNPPIAAGAAVADGTVFVPSGGVTAFDVTNGRVKWSVPVEVYTTVSVTNGLVFVPTRNQAVFLNVRNGAFVGSEDMTDFVESTPAIDAAGVIYLADTDGFREALDRAAGRSVWTRQIAGFASFEGSPAIANRVMLIGNTDGVLRAIDTRNGDILWRRQQQMASSTPALAAGMVIAQGTSGDLTAYAPA